MGLVFPLPTGTPVLLAHPLNGGHVASGYRSTNTAEPPTFTDPVVVGSSVQLLWGHTDRGPCFNHLTFSYNITWYPVVGGVPQRGEGQMGITGQGATVYIITNLMNDTYYQVELFGFTPIHPPVFSSVATVDFTTKGANICDSAVINITMGTTTHLIATITATSLVFCVVVSVFVIVIMALSIKTHQLTKRVKELTADSQRTAEPEVEMETNPSYIQVMAMEVQWWAAFLVGLFCQGALGAAQRVFLSSNNPTPCYNNTVDLICYYPHVRERVNGQRRYLGTTGSWRVNGENLFPDEYVFDQRSINQTASRLRVRIYPANFTGDPVSFTCFLPLTSGGEDSASTVVDPQATAAPPILGDPVVDGSDIRLLWDHTDKGPCYSHLTFSYNITWYPVNVQRETATTDVAATEHVITVNSRYQFQVTVLGFSASRPHVYTSPAYVQIEIKGLSTHDATCSDDDATSSDSPVHAFDIAILAPSVMATVSCVANVLLVVIVVVVSVKCHRLRQQEQQRHLKSSPAQDSDIELQANPSYVTVGPAQTQ